MTITRTLLRTGESEYLLNKTTTRLRDILDLFAGTGANPRAYSVMDQDKLNHVLTAKPHERRVFIEEAAGIARYKQQRGEAQRLERDRLAARIRPGDDERRVLAPEADVDGQVHTNAMENFWSLLKRGIKGTYVAVEPFHLFRYLDEQVRRFNERKGTARSRFVSIVRSIVGRRVTYAELTGKARP